MAKFILGIIITLLVLVLGGLGYAMLGFIPTNANVAPSHLEHRLANTAMDASMERHAPHVTNPLTPSDQNLIDGMKLYTMNCALCHGGLDRMPAWSNVLPEQDMWKITSFLSHMDKLPPAVQDYWKNSFNPAPAADEKKENEKKETHKH